MSGDCKRASLQVVLILPVTLLLISSGCAPVAPSDAFGPSDPTDSAPGTGSEPSTSEGGNSSTGQANEDPATSPDAQPTSNPVNDPADAPTNEPQEPAVVPQNSDPGTERPQDEAEFLLTGALSASQPFESRSLGPMTAGTQLRVQHAALGGPQLVITIFDENDTMLHRGNFAFGTTLTHVLRQDYEDISIAVTPNFSASFGEYAVDVAASAGAVIPSPNTQRVYLNFAGATDLTVAFQPPISFGPFQGSDIDAQYATETEALKTLIVGLMRQHFADYDVEFYTSDEGTFPPTPFTTIHFGGDGVSLLGLADSVDRYNLDRSQNGIVYVETFGLYAVMQLSTTGMAQMIANVGSHELGHLLGLYHTADPGNIMDTTGSAWDLAGPQSFTRAVLEQNVFPVGFEDTATMLTRTVGLNPDPDAGQNLPPAVLQAKFEQRYRHIPGFDGGILGHRCGNCARMESAK